MKNRFSGPCRECGLDVPVGAGTYEKNPAGGKGFNRHRHCDTKARLGREPSSILSEAQRASIAKPERHPFQVQPLNEPRGEGGGWEPCADDAPGVQFFPERVTDPDDADVRGGWPTRQEAQAECDRLNQKGE